jgi:hypothetical protein
MYLVGWAWHVFCALVTDRSHLNYVLSQARCFVAAPTGCLLSRLCFAAELLGLRHMSWLRLYAEQGMPGPTASLPDAAGVSARARRVLPLYSVYCAACIC